MAVTKKICAMEMIFMEIKAKYSYDKNTGFPVMVNLTVINEIYYKIKRADRFNDKSEGTKRNKKKAKQLWGTNNGLLPISRQRFDRIKKGMNFSISNNEAIKMAQLFGIEKEYFGADEPVMFEIDNISEFDWKSYFYNQYQVKYDIDVTDTEKIKESVRLVKEALGKLSKSIGKDDPVMRKAVHKVRYYFETGIKYGEEIQIDKCISILKEIDYSYWDKEAETEDGQKKLAVCLKLLKEHYSYVNSLNTIQRLKKGKTEKEKL